MKNPSPIAALVVALFLAVSCEKPKPPIETESVQHAGETIPATHAPAPIDPCADSDQRVGEIDNGVEYENSTKPTGKIKEVDFDKHRNEQYETLKLCWRRRFTNKGKPDFAFRRDFSSPITLGMTPQEVADALPMLPKELVGTVITPDSPYSISWVSEGCGYPQDAKYGTVCEYSHPITGSRQYMALNGNSFPDSAMFFFDGKGADARLRDFIVTFSLSVAAFDTTDDVIRSVRSDLFDLGPPDTADSTSATWSFVADGTTSTIFWASLKVRRKGRAFVTTFAATDKP